MRELHYRWDIGPLCFVSLAGLVPAVGTPSFRDLPQEAHVTFVFCCRVAKARVTACVHLQRKP